MPLDQPRVHKKETREFDPKGARDEFWMEDCNYTPPEPLRVRAEHACVGADAPLLLERRMT